MTLRRAAFRSLAAFLASATFVDSALAVPYYRRALLFGTATPSAAPVPPDAAMNKPVEGIGDLKVYGPVSVRARTVAPFEMHLVAGNADGAVAWESVGTPLPDGMSLSRDGVVTGTPAATGTVSGIVIRGTDASGKTGRTQPFSIVTVGPPVVTMPETYSVEAGQPVSIAPVISDAYGSTSWAVIAAEGAGGGTGGSTERSAGPFRAMIADAPARAASDAADSQLPVGVVLSPETGRVTGKAEQKGEFQSLVLAVTDADGATGYSNPFTIRVASKLAIENLRDGYALREGRSMAAIRPYVTGSGGAPYWTLSGFGAPLPDGLSLDGGTGAITGLPRLAGRFPNVVLRVEDTFDGEAISSGRTTFDITSAPTLAMKPVQYLRGSRYGTATRTVEFSVANLIGGGRWFVDGDLPDVAKLDVDTGKVDVRISGEPATYPDLTLRVIDLFDGGTARADFSIVTLPELYVANEGYGLTAERGWRYEFRPQLRGLQGTAKWSVEGDLPAGLELDPTTGAITGTPSSLAAERAIKLVAEDSLDGERAEARYRIQVAPIAPLKIQPVGDLNLEIGGALSYRPTAEGLHGTAAWTISGERPDWLGLDAATGRITGRPPAIGTFGPLTFGVSDDASGEVRSAPFNVVVAPVPLRLSFYPAGATVGQPYRSIDPSFANAKAPFRYALTAGTLPGGLELDEETGAVVGTPTVSGSFPGLVLTATDADGRTANAAFALQVATPPGKPETTLRYESPTLAVGATLSLAPTVAGFVPSSYADTGATPLPAWARLDPATGAIALAPEGQGITTGHQVTATGPDGGKASNVFGFTVTKAPGLGVASGPVPVAVIGRPYSAFPASVAGNPPGLSWSGQGPALPAGLEVAASNGEVRGIPAGPAGSVAGLRLRAVSPSGADGVSPEFSIKVVQPGAPGAAFALTMPSYPEAQVGVPYAAPPPAAAPSVPNLSWSGENLPPGLSVAPATGAVTGTPTAEGTYADVRITASDGAVPVTGTPAAIKVKPAVPAPEPSVSYAPVAAIWGRPLAAVAPTVAAFPGPLAFSPPPGLPAGLTMDETTGAVSGTPTQVVTRTGLVAKVSDGTRTIDSKPFDVAVSAPALVVTTDTARRWFTGVAGTQAAKVDGAMGHVSFRLLKDGSDVTNTFGAIAPGLVFDPVDGSISGKPVTPAIHAGLKIVAEDAGGPRTRESAAFSLAISDASLQVSGTQPSYVVTYRTALAMPAPASTGTGTLSWSLAEGTLPDWAKLGTNGAVTGTPASSADIRTTTGLRLRLDDTNAPFPAYSEPFALIVERPAFTAKGPTGTIEAWTNEALPPTAFPTSTGSVGIVSWSLEGAVPGVALDPKTLSLKGVPSQAGSYDLAVVATDAFDGKAAKARFVLRVKDRPTKLALATDRPAYEVRVGATLAVTATVGDETAPVTWSKPEGLPAWATFDAGSGKIGGIPDAVGAFPGLVLAAEDSKGLKGATDPFSITVRPGIAIADLPAAPGGRAGKAIAAIQPRAANALGPVKWSASGLPAGLSIDEATGRISGTPEVGGSPEATITAKDAADGAAVSTKLAFSIERPLQVVFDPTAFVARVGKPYVSRLPGVVGLRGTPTWSVVGALPSWAAPDAATGAIRGNAPSTTGETAGLKLRVVDAWDGEAVESEAFPLRVLEDLAVVDMATTYSAVYGFELKTGKPTALNAGGPVAWTWGIGAKPGWATLDAATGAVTGVPDVLADAGPLTIVATDATGASAHSVPFTLKVYAKPTVTLDVADGASFKKRVGDTIAIAATPKGLLGTGRFSLAALSGSALPAGLKVDPATGAVSGPFTGSGNARFAVRVTDSVTGAYADSGAVQVEVIDALTIAGIAGNYGTRVNTFLTTDPPDVKGNRGALTYALSIGAPGGLSFSPAGYPGVLRGIPAVGVSGTWPATKVTVTDAYDGRTATAAFDLKILGALTVTGVQAVVLRNDSEASERSFSPIAANVLSPTGATWKASRNVVLPTGVTIDERTGKLTGRPAGYSAAATFPNVRVNATDSDGASVDSAVVTVTVQPALTAGLAIGPQKARVGAAKSLPAPILGGKVGNVGWRIVTLSGKAPAVAAAGSNGAATFTPDAASIGTWVFQLEATDASDGAKALTEAISVTITDVAQIAMPDIVVRITGSRAETPVPTGNEGALTWSLSGNPAWVTVDPASGKVTASPLSTTGAARYAMTLRATEPDGAVGTKPINVDVGARPTLAWPAASGGSVIYARAGEPYVGAAPIFTAAKGKVTYAVATGASCAGPLPDGFGIEASSGVITGTIPPGTPKSTSAAYCFEGRDDYDGAVGAASRTIAVGEPLSVAELPQTIHLTKGLDYDLVGRGVGSFEINRSMNFATAGNLPPGLSFRTTSTSTGNNGLRFLGTVGDAFAAPVTFTVTLKDPVAGDSRDVAFTFVPAPSVTATVPSLTRRVTGLVSLAPQVTGGTAPYAYQLVAGTLPKELTFDPVTGSVTGRMPALASTDYRIRVTDAENRQGDAKFTLASSANNLTTSLSGTPGQAFMVHQNWPRTVTAARGGLLGSASFSPTPPQGVTGSARGPAWATWTADGRFTFSPASGSSSQGYSGLSYWMTDSFDGAYAVGSETTYVNAPYKIYGAVPTGTVALAAKRSRALGTFGVDNAFGPVTWQVVMKSGQANPGFTFEYQDNTQRQPMWMNTPDVHGTYDIALQATDAVDGAVHETPTFTVDVRKLALSYPQPLRIREGADLSRVAALSPTLTNKIKAFNPVTYQMTTGGSNLSRWYIETSTGTFAGNHDGVSGNSYSFGIRATELNAGGQADWFGLVQTGPKPRATYGLGTSSNPAKTRVGKAVPAIPAPSISNLESQGQLVFSTLNSSWGPLPHHTLDPATGGFAPKIATCASAIQSASYFVGTDSWDGAKTDSLYLSYNCAEALDFPALALTVKKGTYFQTSDNRWPLGIMGNRTWTVSGLPTGVTFNNYSGGFYGTPTAAAGDYVVTSTLRDDWDNEVVTKTLTITVAP